MCINTGNENPGLTYTLGDDILRKRKTPNVGETHNIKRSVIDRI